MLLQVYRQHLTLRKVTIHLNFDKTKFAFLIVTSRNGTCKKTAVQNDVDHFTRVPFYSSASFGQKNIWPTNIWYTCCLLY
jgi:hypothetical protein